jgi:hypothetical protein
MRLVTGPYNMNRLSACLVPLIQTPIDCVWNVMAQAQKPDFVFRRNGRVNLNRRGTSVQSTTGSRGVRISGSNAGYTMFWGSVKGTGYPLHSPVSPFTSPPVRYRLPSHFNRTLTKLEELCCCWGLNLVVLSVCWSLLVGMALTDDKLTFYPLISHSIT